MKRLFHLCGFTVSRKARVHTPVKSRMALYLLHEGASEDLHSVELLGIVNRIYYVDGFSGFALTKHDIRRLGGGSFNLAYRMSDAANRSHLVAYTIPDGDDTIAKHILGRLQWVVTNTDKKLWDVPAGVIRGQSPTPEIQMQSVANLVVLV
jgi:hypothetical protein